MLHTQLLSSREGAAAFTARVRCSGKPGTKRYKKPPPSAEPRGYSERCDWLNHRALCMSDEQHQPLHGSDGWGECKTRTRAPASGDRNFLPDAPRHHIPRHFLSARPAYSTTSCTTSQTHLQNACTRDVLDKAPSQLQQASHHVCVYSPRMHDGSRPASAPWSSTANAPLRFFISSYPSQNTARSESWLAVEL